jgi:hypothetical protein
MAHNSFDGIPARETLTTPTEAGVVPDDTTSPQEISTPEKKFEAEYTLESPVRCPVCGERITTVRAVRLLRSKVNFTSTLPRRGRVMTCPQCLAVIPAELTNF